MRSRYDYMTESKVLDIDDMAFPDPLSVNYNNIQLTELPMYVKIEQKYIDSFWTFMYDYYKTTEMDDVFLNINNVPYIGALEPGDILFLIKGSDLTNFKNQKQLGTRN